jgi:hypothetical protein
MSLAYIRMLGREVVALVPLFTIHVSKLYKQMNEFKVLITFLQVEGVSQRKIHHRLVSVHGQNIFSLKVMSLWCNKFKDGRRTLNEVPEKRRGRQTKDLAH